MFVDKVQIILGQLGDYKHVLVKGKSILRFKGVKMWSFDGPLQRDNFQDTIIEVSLFVAI